jgi:hypothetical protein
VLVVVVVEAGRRGRENIGCGMGDVVGNGREGRREGVYLLFSGFDGKGAAFVMRFCRLLAGCGEGERLQRKLGRGEE